MENILGQTKYHELVQWQHDRDPKLSWSYVKLKGSQAATGDDGVCIVPVIKEGPEPVLILQSHIRPARMGSKTGGISIEVPAGLTTDKDALGQKAEANAKRELAEETGLEVKKLHKVMGSIPGDVGAETGSCGMFVAECKNTDKIGPQKEPDISELALFSVPLKDALAYLMDATKKGVDVTYTTFIGVLAALQQFKMPVKLDAAIPRPKLLWSVVNGKPNELQKDGLELLKKNKAFLPEAAVKKEQASGLMSKVFGWVRGLFGGK